MTHVAAADLQVAVFQDSLAVDRCGARCSEPSTSTSTRTHWSPRYVSRVGIEAVRLHHLAIAEDLCSRRADVRSRTLARGPPPSNWASTEIGKSWSLPIVSGAWQWNMMPLLRSAHAGPPFTCSPTNRYSAATM